MHSETTGDGTLEIKRSFVPGRVVVCAFDPGVTTGWCWMSASRNSLLTKGTGDILREVRPDVELATLDPAVAGMDLGMEFGQLGAKARDDDERVDLMVQNLRACWGAYSVDPAVDVFAVVSERFTLREMNMSQDLLAPVRLNAKLERDLRNAGMGVLYQTPSDAKTVATDARLKHWNVYDRGSGLHARDAQRHAILFLRRWASTPTLRHSLGSGAPKNPRR